MSLDDVAEGSAHVTAHNDERHAINALLLALASAGLTTEEVQALIDDSIAGLGGGGDGADNTYVTSTAEADRVDRMDEGIRRSAAGRSAVEYTDSVEVVEDWADLLTGTFTGVQVSAGRLYSNVSAGVAGFNIPANLPLNGRWKLQTLLYFVVAGATPAIPFFGISAGTAGHAPMGNDPDMIAAAGFYGGTARSILIGSNFTAVNKYAPAYDGSAPTVDSTYLITVEADDEDISVTMKNLNVQTDIAVWSCEKADITALGKTVVNVYGYLSDSRKLTGHSFGPWILSQSLQPSRTKVVAGQTIQGSVETFRRRSTGIIAANNTQIITIPKNYDARRPSPVCLWSHQSISGNAWNLWSTGQMVTVGQALMDNGFIVAGVNEPGAAGTWGMGNQTDLDELADVYKFLRTNYNCGQLFYFGASMGGLVIANLIGRNQLPTPAAAATVGGAFDIGAIWDLGAATFQPLVEAAYGASGRADLLTKSTGYDPIRRPGILNKQVPWRQYTSLGDTLASSAMEEHFKTIISPYAAEATTVYGTGDHLDASQFQPADLMAFFNQYRS